MEGGTLNEAIKIHAFSERHIKYITKEILKGIAFLHSKNLVHRDIKSSNIMMTNQGNVKIIDFGLCADISEGERTQMLGSAFWMPPEMILRIPHGFPVDIWSFGVCVIEMYLRHPPHYDSRIKSMFMSSTGRILESILTSTVTDLAKDFITKCLQVDQKVRATAVELLEHPYVKNTKSKKGIDKILHAIFMSANMSNFNDV